MSATLTWYNSGLGTKTNTTAASFFTDLNTLVTSKSGDANFKWQVAGVNDSSAPYYLVLSRKDGSAGRILFVCWTSGPAGNNSAILDGAPTNNAIYVAWFPAGTANTPSNLTASSGTILGVDTNCTKVAGTGVANIYATSRQPFYFDSAEGVLIGTQNPAQSISCCLAAGDLIVDGNDVAYGMSGYWQTYQFGTATGSLVYTATKPNAGSTAEQIRSNAQASNNVFYGAFIANPWARTNIGSTDVLTDTSNSKVWFVPYPLLSNVKGGGFGFKLRQMGWGPQNQTAFAQYSITGPTVTATVFDATTTGNNGAMWCTNFKL